RLHLNETEALGLSRETVSDDHGLFDVARCREQILQVFLGRRVRQAAHIDTFRHCLPTPYDSILAGSFDPARHARTGGLAFPMAHVSVEPERKQVKKGAIRYPNHRTLARTN